MIKTQDPLFKSKIFYNMANCAVALKHYDRAKELYKKALALNPQDKEAEENLMQLYALRVKEKQDVADMMPHVNAKQTTIASRKNEIQKEQNNDAQQNNGSKGQHSAEASSQAGSKMKKNTKTNQKIFSPNNKEYKFGYSAYELINKGYINETNPW
jgi:Ca-activated chloride channel family protein